MSVNMRILGPILIYTIMAGPFLHGQSYTWEIDRQAAKRREQQSLDSLAISQQAFLYSSQLYLKTEFPTQLALGYQFISPKGLAFHGSFGLYPRGFTRAILNLAPTEDAETAERLDFLQDRLRNGSVIEVGIGYYLLQPGLFGLLSLQFQQISIATTTNELVESLSGVDTPAELAEQLEDSPVLESFFYEEMVYPTFRPIQLVMSLGKRFRFRSLPQLSLSTHLSYSLNLHTGIKVRASSVVGNAVMENLVNPILEDSELGIGGVSVPTLSVTIGYQFGAVIR